MKSSAIPAICGLSLAAMSAAGLSHWWTVEQLVATLDIEKPSVRESIRPQSAAGILAAATKPTEKPAPELVPKDKPSASLLAGDPGVAQKEFYENLLLEMRKLRTENRDLIDQMASTNRDLMQLQFRVDTHSQSFRPLPVSEERIETTFGEEDGVLPPRATPVPLPTGE